LESINLTDFRRIKKMNLGYTKISDDNLEELAKKLTNLEELCLKGCLQLKYVNLIGCKNIKKLNLGFTKIEDNNLEQLIKELPNL
jgi:hypothetical protein